MRAAGGAQTGDSPLKVRGYVKDRRRNSESGLNRPNMAEAKDANRTGRPVGGARVAKRPRLEHCVLRFKEIFIESDTEELATLHAATGRCF